MDFPFIRVYTLARRQLIAPVNSGKVCDAAMVASYIKKRAQIHRMNDVSAPVLDHDPAY